jgi:hypothetical protein
LLIDAEIQPGENCPVPAISRLRSQSTATDLPRTRQAGMMPSRDPARHRRTDVVIGPPHRLALASAGDLKQVGIEKDPEGLVARAVCTGRQPG